MLLAVLLFTVTAPIQADYASHHVLNFLNHSVSPCDNFYRHVCSERMPKKESISAKTKTHYLELAKQLKSRTLNNPVMHDITEARTTLDCTFDVDTYYTLLGDRCDTDFDCYFDEFLYFFNLHETTMGGEDIDESLEFYSTHGNKVNPSIGKKTNEQRIEECMVATAGVIALLYDVPDVEKEFKTKTSIYHNIVDRLFVMEHINTNTIGLEKLHNLSRLMKGVIRNKLQKTSWMYLKNSFGFDIVSQYLTVIDELTVRTDFDAFDRNLTTLRRVNRHATAKYFEYSTRTTGCTWFDIVHTFGTIAHEPNEELNLYAEQILGETSGFDQQAWNFMDGNNILVLATTFYPSLVNSTEATNFAYAGDFIGHEMYHSFVTDALLARSEAFKNEIECMTKHYVRICQLFAEGECNSGEATFTEDGPDLEGWRAGYELLKMKFNKNQLKALEYPKFGITREQSFFYSSAMYWCGPIGWDDTHSPNNIRVNGRASLMPEFSQAFGCQPEDALYSEPDTTCYLFGEMSTGENVNTMEETERNSNEDEDSY